MREGEKRNVSRVLSLHNCTSFFIPNSVYCLVYCLYWGRLDVPRFWQRREDKIRQDKTRQERWAHNTRHPTGWKDVASATIERFSSPVPDPKAEGGTTGEPETHTQSVDNDNKGLLVVIRVRGKQGREGRREKLSSSHFNFNAFSHWIIIVVFIKCNNKILVFIISSILSLSIVLGRIITHAR